MNRPIFLKHVLLSCMHSFIFPAVNLSPKMCTFYYQVTISKNQVRPSFTSLNTNLFETMVLKLSSVLSVLTMTATRRSTMSTAAAEHLRSNDAQIVNRKLAGDPILVQSPEGCFQFDDASLASSCASLAVDANGDLVCHYCENGVTLTYMDPDTKVEVTNTHNCVALDVNCE